MSRPPLEFDLNHGHFIQRTTPNSEIHCRGSFFCKRMICHRCKERRREFFVMTGQALFRNSPPISHLTVNWLQSSHMSAWEVLLGFLPRLLNFISQKAIRPYLRVLGVGSNNHPHLHLIAPKSNSALILNKARSLIPLETRTSSRDIFDLTGLLGYLFDQNLLTAHLDPHRPKGLRTISGSRGFRYGFPSAENEQELQELLTQAGPLDFCRGLT